jgi:CheY-like chemotaxis protein
VTRIALIHWAPKEARDRAKTLRAAGHTVVLAAPEGASQIAPLLARPPDVFIIDLGRAPSQGRDTALYLRQRKATRNVPIVFAGGETDKVDRARKLLPDAAFTSWRGIRSSLRKALSNPPAKPVVRDALAGYSGTPLFKKLGIKTGARVAMLGAPKDFVGKLDPLPPGIRLQTTARGGPDLIILFARSRSDLSRRFPAAAGALAEGGGLWIAWPKLASGVKSDLTQTHVRNFGLDREFVDYKICAMDETWSGLKFARRR